MSTATMQVQTQPSVEEVLHKLSLDQFMKSQGQTNLMVGWDFDPQDRGRSQPPNLNNPREQMQPIEDWVCRVLVPSTKPWQKIPFAAWARPRQDNCFDMRINVSRWRPVSDAQMQLTCKKRRIIAMEIQMMDILVAVAQWQDFYGGVLTPQPLNNWAPVHRALFDWAIVERELAKKEGIPAGILLKNRDKAIRLLFGEAAAKSVIYSGPDFRCDGFLLDARDIEDSLMWAKAHYLDFSHGIDADLSVYDREAGTLTGPPTPRASNYHCFHAGGIAYDLTPCTAAA